MNKKMFVFFVVLGAASLPGVEPCKITVEPKASGKELAKKKDIQLNHAQCYAHELANVTSEYLKALEVQVSGQQDMYDQLAKHYDSSQRTIASLGLDVDRDNAIESWIGRLSNQSMNVASVMDEMTKMASGEFQATRAQHERDLDGTAEYLKALNNLEVDTKKVAGLSSLFNDLAQPPDLKSWLSDLGAFGEGVQTQMKQAGCALAKSRLGFFTGESTRLAGLMAKPGVSADQKAVYSTQKDAADKQVKALQDAAGKCAAATQSTN